MRKEIKKYLILNGYFGIVNDYFDHLRTHPNASSFNAITDTLNYFGISNLALKIDPEKLKELPKNFLTVIRYDNEDVIALVERKKSQF
ncbi:MAG: hypothetical protein ABGW99_16385 [Zunongwangia sp.]|jgi:hypothetical protein|uniref:hypothetical protein n=1 Tax=Zunongwangia sp. TaxID=1965325 RepID=UPI0032425EC8